MTSLARLPRPYGIGFVHGTAVEGKLHATATVQLLSSDALTRGTLTYFTEGLALMLHILPRISFLPVMTAGFMWLYVVTCF